MHPHFYFCLSVPFCCLYHDSECLQKFFLHYFFHLLFVSEDCSLVFESILAFAIPFELLFVLLVLFSFFVCLFVFSCVCVHLFLIFRYSFLSLYLFVYVCSFFFLHEIYLRYTISLHLCILISTQKKLNLHEIFADGTRVLRLHETIHSD